MTIEENIIKADEGTVLTNGENYATVVRLGDWDSADNWTEITKAEYDEIIRQMETEEVI